MEIPLLSSLLCVLMRLGAAQYTFTIRGSSSEVALGSPYSFTCVQSGALPDTAGQGVFFVKNGTYTFCSTFRTQCNSSFSPNSSCGCVDSSGGTYMYHYNISGVGSEHTGSWRCRISVQGTSINTDPFNLTVLVAPKVTLVNSSHVNVTDGKQVNLTCEATGSPAPSFSWSRSETPVSSGSRSSLTFTPDRRDGNSQTVTCTASNSAGTDSASFSLNVQYPPVSDPVISSNSPVNEGYDVTLTCNITGGNPPVSSVTLTCPRGHTSTTPGSLGRLQFTADRRDQGSCVCSASHVLGYTHTASISLIVHYAPDVTLAVSSEGQGQVITCTAEGHPDTYTFQPWLQTWGGQEVRRVTGSQQGGQYNLTLTSYQDTGTYTCSVDNGVRNRQGELIVSRTSANVSVEDSPQFSTLPDTQGGEVGRIARLYRTVYSYPALINHTWYFNPPTMAASGFDSNSSSSSRARIRLSVHDHEVTTDGWNVTLDVTVHADTTGAYRLEVCNSLSCQSTQVTLMTMPASMNTGSMSPSVGPLVGGVVGGLAGLVVLVIVIVFLFKKRKKLASSDQAVSQASLDNKLADEEPGNSSKSSDGIGHPIFDEDVTEHVDSQGPITYAVAQKKTKKKQSSKQNTEQLYTQVNKKPAGKTSMHPNVSAKSEKTAPGAKAKTMDNQQRRSIHDDGCVYITVEKTEKPTSPPQSRKPQTPKSQDDAVIYTVIDHTKKGPKLVDEEDMTQK